MLGYDLKIACVKFQGNRFIIDGEIDEKRALQKHQNECGPGYIGNIETSVSTASKHETLNQCLFNVGPPSATLAQHYTSIGSMLFSGR